jgi:hypothetical protein
MQMKGEEWMPICAVKMGVAAACWREAISERGACEGHGRLGRQWIWTLVQIWMVFGPRSIKIYERLHVMIGTDKAYAHHSL